MFWNECFTGKSFTQFEPMYLRIRYFFVWMLTTLYVYELTQHVTRPLIIGEEIGSNLGSTPRYN